MSKLEYHGQGERRETLPPKATPYDVASRRLHPGDYRAAPDLAAAVTVALTLNQPLLLTGEPGTGKTQLAYSLAWELNLEPPLKFETKSDSKASDLFYYYDALGRFQARQAGGESSDPLSYISFNALGLAVLLSRNPEDVRELLPPGFEHDGRRRSVVLIDEVDKAPRDFPNDILNELELLYFRIPELGGVRIEADSELRPIVVITSNSEKDLPGAFLRRCIYYHIEFPGPEVLKEIVALRLARLLGSDDGTQRESPDGDTAAGTTFLDDAVELFLELRSRTTGLLKKPATAELLNWLTAMVRLAPVPHDPLEDPRIVMRTLPSLVKTEKDQHEARKIVEAWIRTRARVSSSG